jgi:hypothetical protein
MILLMAGSRPLSDQSTEQRSCQPEDRLRAREAGIDRFFVKPAAMEDIERFIAGLRL